jgi:TPR repeat protein
MKTTILLRTICLCIGLLLWSSPTAAQRSDATKGNVKSASSAGLERGIALYQSSKFKAAFEILEPIAEAGNPNAQTILGVMYDDGEGVAQDPEKAALWYRKAAEQGHPSAQVNLGRLKWEGRGTPQSYESATYWFGKAAEQGNARAQLNLGVSYANGQGVARNYVEAARWFQAAADQGHPTAQFNLGKMYLNGDGLPQDFGFAAEWLEKASAQGEKRAQELLNTIPPHQKGSAPKQTINASSPTSKRASETSPNQQACEGFGFKRNDSGFSQCLLQLAEAQRQAAQWQQQHDLQVRQYEQQLAIYTAQQEAIRRERNRQQGEALMRFGQGIMNSQSPTFAGGIADGLNALNGLPPVSQPLPPPTLPAIQHFSIRTAEGNQVYCSYSTATGEMNCR